MKFIKALLGIPILVHSSSFRQTTKEVRVLRRPLEFDYDNSMLPSDVFAESMSPLTIDKMTIMSKSMQFSLDSYNSSQNLIEYYQINMKNGMCHEEGENCVLTSGEHYGTKKNIDQVLLINKDSYCFAAFKGSQGPAEELLDWTEQNFDTKTVKLEAREGTRFCMVQQGFLDAYHGWSDGRHVDESRKYFEELETWIDACMSKTPDKQLILTGHSQGGSISTIASIRNAHHNPLTIPHAAPPVLMEPCNWLVGEHYWRTINTVMKDSQWGMDYDIAPFAGTVTGAYHTGERLLLPHKTPYESAKYIDSSDPERYQSAYTMNADFGAHMQDSYADKLHGLLNYAKNNNQTQVKISGFSIGSGCQYEFECDSGRCDWEDYNPITAKHKCHSTKQNGEGCNEDEDCESWRCEANPILWECVDIGKHGDSCSNDNDCESGRCESNPIFFECVNIGKLGDSCSEDDDCEEGLDCRGFTDWKCEIAKSPIGTSCSSDTDCESNRCEMDPIAWKCVNKGKIGELCSEDDDCETNRCETFLTGNQCQEVGQEGDTCSNNNDCGFGLDCRGLAPPWRCQKAISDNGISCNSDNDCESGRCEMDGFGWKCVSKGKLGDSCSEDDDCENDLECRGITSWKCEEPKAPNGARCTFDSDCASNRCECGWGCACTSRGKKGDSCSNDGDCEPGLECKGWFDWDCE